MVHSVSGWTRSVQVKLWDPLRTSSSSSSSSSTNFIATQVLQKLQGRWTRVIPERLRGVFTTRRYTNPPLPLLSPLPPGLWLISHADWLPMRLGSAPPPRSTYLYGYEYDLPLYESLFTNYSRSIAWYNSTGRAIQFSDTIRRRIETGCSTTLLLNGIFAGRVCIWHFAEALASCNFITVIYMIRH